MKRHIFSSYREYIKSQCRLTRYKLKPMRHGESSVHKWVVKAIHEYWSTHQVYPVANGLCHGVRRATEIDLFQKEFNQGHWIGTEIYKPSCDGIKIIHHDFSKPMDESFPKFDIIYSNSFDHSRDPRVTARVWLQSLSPTGRLFIEWTTWHDVIGRGRNTADCFSASEIEYHTLLSNIGIVHDVILVRQPRKKWNKAIFVVGR